MYNGIHFLFLEGIKIPPKSDLLTSWIKLTYLLLFYERIAKMKLNDTEDFMAWKINDSMQDVLKKQWIKNMI